SNWQMVVVPAGQLTNVESEQEQNNQSLKQVITAWDPSSLYDKGYYKKVDDVLSYEYPYQEATRTNAKQSVTEIKRRQEMTDAFSDERLVQPYRAPLTKRPRFMQEETSLSAAEIGTAMHAVMQHLSFKESYDIEELQHLIDKLVQDEILTEKEADAIDLQAILAFLETDIATILKQTDHVEREV